MRKNLYKKFQKESKIKKVYDDKVIINKSNTLKTILSFISDFIGKAMKLIFYILVVALCSLGATFLFNYILKGGNLW